jgi:hypothetical protein
MSSRPRWELLFADQDAQLEQARHAELEAEVADRARRELGRLRLVDRLRPVRGALVTFDCPGGVLVEGLLRDVGPDWALVEEPGRRAVVVALEHVLGVVGAGRASEVVPDGAEVVAQRWDLRHVLRGLVRDRAPVQLVLRDGRLLGGTLDRVGQDHVDLAEHDLAELRRAAAVRQVRLVPLAAVAVVRAAG